MSGHLNFSLHNNLRSETGRGRGGIFYFRLSADRKNLRKRGEIHYNRGWAGLGEPASWKVYREKYSIMSPQKSPPKDAGAGAPPKNFESALSELEDIAARLESGDAPLEEAVAVYERGAALIDFCQKRLAAARGKIQKLEKQALVDMDDVGE